MLESGMDNSPMYDKADFCAENNMLNLADVGLTSMVLLDCQNLLKMAKLLERTKEAEELQQKIDCIQRNILYFWHEERGFFYNRFVDGRFSFDCSPTSFYALYSDNLSQEMISRIINEHFYNPNEF